MRGGKNCINRYDKRAWNWLESFMAENYVDLDKLFPKVSHDIYIGSNKIQFKDMPKKESEKLTKEVLSKQIPWTNKKIAETMAEWF